MRTTVNVHNSEIVLWKHIFASGAHCFCSGAVKTVPVTTRRVSFELAFLRPPLFFGHLKRQREANQDRFFLANASDYLFRQPARRGIASPTPATIQRIPLRIRKLNCRRAL